VTAVSAYVLLGDPSWLPLAVESWYPAVDRIVASYDQDGRSWSGGDISSGIDRCLGLLDDLDVDGKVEAVPGDFVAPDDDLLGAETAHRQAALDAAAGGDRDRWVLQLDCDEVVPDLAALIGQIHRSDADHLDALWYPARWLYTHIRGRWYTEMVTRRLHRWEAFPGPVAVRGGTRLTLTRQTEASARQLHFGDGRGDTVTLDQAILHFSMVRSVEVMEWKSTISAHARNLDWDRRLALWHQARRHPLPACAASIRHPEFGSYRPVRLPAAYGSSIVEAQTSLFRPTAS
jgi:hypothetical protein